MQSDITLSIIIPVYNGANTVTRLLDSIYEQDTNQIEVIVINDGSTDETKDVVLKYTTFPNFIYIEKENSGVSMSRNLGIESASTKYVTFADSDDYYEKGSLMKILEAISEDDPDVLCFNYYLTRSKNNKTPMLQLTDYGIEYLKEDEGFINYLNDKFFSKYCNSVWNKVYKKTILQSKNIMFDVTKRIGEDLLFNAEYFGTIKSIKTLNTCLYNYYEQEGSVMRRYNKFFVKDAIGYIDSIEKIIKRHNFCVPDSNISQFFLSRFFGVMNNESLGPTYIDGLHNLKLFRSVMKKRDYWKALKWSNLNSKLKIFYLLLKTRLYILVYSFMFIKNKGNRKMVKK